MSENNEAEISECNCIRKIGNDGVLSVDYGFEQWKCILLYYLYGHEIMINQGGGIKHPIDNIEWLVKHHGNIVEFYELAQLHSLAHIRNRLVHWQFEIWLYCGKNSWEICESQISFDLLSYKSNNAKKSFMNSHFSCDLRDGYYTHRT